MTAPAATGGERPPLLELAIFTVGMTAAGLVLLALAWSGTGPYADMARANGVASVELFAPGGEPVRVGLDDVVELHRAWSFYVTGGGDAPPVFSTVRFGDDEVSHMSDVRHVFDLVKLAVPAGLFVVIVLLQRARRRGARAMWRLVRDGALAAAAIVALVGATAVLAFDVLFLLFHEVFFPQGNFLFDPASSDLIRLYPDWYWEGITLRMGASFIAATLVLAILAIVWRRRAVT